MITRSIGSSTHTEIIRSKEFSIPTSSGSRDQRLWADCTLGQPFSFAGKRRWKADKGPESHNWDAQNPAIQAFTATEANGCTLDELFVIGRNIYQAAYGSSYGAIDFLDECAHAVRLQVPSQRVQ
jgi:hypothetical protein